jgi:hypothetical protein
MSAATWNVVGLLLNLLGVLTLFRYGMPYRVASGGETSIITGDINQSEIALDKRYRVFGWVGVVMVICGTAAQIISSIT